jgi:prophage antirepressor-like protein
MVYAVRDDYPVNGVNKGVIGMKENSTLSIFKFEDESSGRFWYIRLLGLPKAPEWVFSDVVAVLYPEVDPSDYANYFAQIPAEWKSHRRILTSEGDQLVSTVYESGLYYLIVHCDRSLGIQFQKWITKEVLSLVRPGVNASLASVFSVEKLSAKDRLETIRLGIDLLSELGGIDERTQLFLREQVKEILMEDRPKKTAWFSNEKTGWKSSDTARQLELLQTISKADETHAENQLTHEINSERKRESFPFE